MIKKSIAAVALVMPLLAHADDPQVARGAYLAKAGDCVACHSAPKGKPFAGGLPMTTPMGKIYTTNITPDPETGIGGWTEEDFDRVVQVNIKGSYNSIRAVVGHMKNSGGGVIVNLASIAGSAGLTDRFAYSTSKGAIVAMTYSVARDYLAHNIRCNCISPARVHTPFVDGYLQRNYPGHEKEMFEKLAKSQPIGRMAEPAEVASLALFLCSDEAAFITGVDYPIDGGFFNLRG